MKRNSLFNIIYDFLFLFSIYTLLFVAKGKMYDSDFLDFSFIIKTICFFVVGYFILHIVLKKKVYIKSNNRSPKIYFFIWIIYFFTLSLLFLKSWAISRFPLENPEIVYNTLLNIKGKIDTNIFKEALMSLSFCALITCLFAFISCSLHKKSTIYNIIEIKYKKLQVNKLHFLFSIFCFILSLLNIYSDLLVKDYIAITRRYSKEPVYSTFYEREYRIPKYENIIFPRKKRNLIVIFMESMESSFSDKENGGLINKNLIPNLTNLANYNINFSNTEKIGGGVDLAGTGWTVAAMLAKFAGLPFNLPGNENLSRNVFLPNAITLTDILAKNEYNQLFICGSDKHFAGRDALLETHGNVKIHDINWYKENNLLPKDYDIFLGFEDEKLYEYAKIELEKLSNDEKPFMFSFLTVDTHMPEGNQCELCPTTEDMPLKNSILCADKQVFNFINWCEEQNWYENTTIVLFGDHLFMATEETSPFEKGKYLTSHALKSEIETSEENPRRWIDIFINTPVSFDTATTQIKNRKFSSFDMFPTILASIGCTIKDNRLGFGVNLFSDEKTICEKYSEQYINTELMTRNLQYLNFEGQNDY